MKNLSTHFTDKEFYAGQEDLYQELTRVGVDPAYFISPILVRVVERIRKHFDKPVKITSGLRTKEHNAEIGGKTHSMHLYGIAVDIIVADTPASEVQEFCYKIPEIKGLGKANTFTHIDVRNRLEGRSEWTYS